MSTLKIASLSVKLSMAFNLYHNKGTKQRQKRTKGRLDACRDQNYGDWRRCREIDDDGGGGSVYVCKNVIDDRIAALKLDSGEEGSSRRVKNEAKILKRLNKNGPVPHIPHIFRASERRNKWFIVMTLLGPNLEDLQTKYGTNNGGFSAGTWSRVGIQCLYGLKFIHDKGFLHRNIKPQNILTGVPSDRERARLVHIIDFELGRQYAKLNKINKRWESVPVFTNHEFRGFRRYKSPNVDKPKEQGRVDDLWSLLYVLIELNGNPMLPWQNAPDRATVRKLKEKCSAELVMAHMPVCMHRVLTAFEKVGCHQMPDYHQFFTALWKVMENANETPSSKYDWESEEPSKTLHTAAWEDPAGTFFTTEPFKLNVILTIKDVLKEQRPSSSNNDQSDDHEDGIQAFPAMPFVP